jgi:hypothetical protein
MSRFAGRSAYAGGKLRIARGCGVVVLAGDAGEAVASIQGGVVLDETLLQGRAVVWSATASR